MEEMTMKKQILSLAAGVALVFAASNSFAGAAPAGQLDYTVLLNAGCTASVSAGPISLDGGLGVNAPYIDLENVAAGNVTVNCSNTTLYAICFDGGTAPGASARTLTDPVSTDTLTYNLKDASGGTVVGDAGCNDLGGPADTAVWAAPWGGVGPQTLIGNATDQVYNVFADVTIPPASTPGTYSDSIQVTVVW